MKNRVHNSLVRVSGSHAKEQVFRFLRIFAVTLLPQLVALDFDHLTRSTIIALIVPAVEVALRQVQQVVPTGDVSYPPNNVPMANTGVDPNV